MNIKTLVKIPYLLLAMTALSSCSSMNNMQAMPASAGHGVHITKHHARVTEHYKTTYTKQHVVSEPAENIPQQAPVHITKPKQTMPQAVTPKPSMPKPAPAKPVKQEMPKVVKPKQTMPVAEIFKPQAVTTAPKPIVAPVAAPAPKVVTISIVSPNPVIGDQYLLNVHGIDFNSNQYRSMDARSVVMNVRRLDAKSGQYHFIQAARWDGQHVDQTYINARTAAIMSLLGLDMLANGHIDTDFGTTILVFGGNAYIVDISGHKIDLILRGSRGVQKTSKPVPVKTGPSTTTNVTTPQKDSFDITGFNEIVSPDRLITMTNQYCSIDNASSVMNLAETAEQGSSAPITAAAAAHQQAMNASEELMASNEEGTAISETLREHLQILEE